ncbi:MAG: dTMP kinase [Actinomycetaceae bacterium]|nr:dTMP kinase [Actinomycetaceae bacterium]
MRGHFITFEGGDGVGKTTQITLLADYLRAQGREVVVSREPGGTPLGSQIRELLLHGGEVSPRAEALLYAADRAHHADTVIRPALDRGAIVLCDRYLDSSVAYQGAGRVLGAGEIRELSLWATENLLPDVTFLLDLPVEISAARVGAEQDRIESAGRDFHEAVRAQFLELAAKEPERWRVIDASVDVEEIAYQINEHVRKLLAV